jgi:hypothetical protein
MHISIKQVCNDNNTLSPLCRWTTDNVEMVALQALTMGPSPDYTPSELLPPQARPGPGVMKPGGRNHYGAPYIVHPSLQHQVSGAMRWFDRANR